MFSAQWDACRMVVSHPDHRSFSTGEIGQVLSSSGVVVRAMHGPITCWRLLQRIIRKGLRISYIYCVCCGCPTSHHLVLLIRQSQQVHTTAMANIWPLHKWLSCISQHSHATSQLCIVDLSVEKVSTVGQRDSLNASSRHNCQAVPSTTRRSIKLSHVSISEEKSMC